MRCVLSLNLNFCILGFDDASGFLLVGDFAFSGLMF